MQTSLLRFTTKGERTRWRTEPDGLLICTYQWQQLPPPPSGDGIKMAAYDLDHTLICPRTPGHRFSRNERDWKFLYPNAVETLRRFHRDGYTIVIFSNQNGLELDASGRRLLQFKCKVEWVLEEVHNCCSNNPHACIMLDQINLPCLLMAAVRKNRYRKPCVGMLERFIEMIGGGHCGLINQKDSFYIGDAAGRQMGWHPDYPSDFANTDRKFAMNANLPFFTPEEHFLGWPVTEAYSLGPFNPRIHLKGSGSTDRLDELMSDLSMIQPLLIVLVGPPTSGKTRFCNRIIGGGTIKCYVNTNPSKKTIRAGLDGTFSLVIDSTNPAKSTRTGLIEVARSSGYRTACLIFDCDIDLAMHLGSLRNICEGIPPPAEYEYYDYFRKFEEPLVEEGFEKVLRVPFIPDISNETVRKYIHHYLN